MNRTFEVCCWAALGFAVFYGGGWSVIWGAQLNQFSLLINGDLPLGRDLLFGGRYIAVLFNSEYYGIVIVNRFFDSPFISYGAFGAGVVMFFSAVKALVPEEAEDEQSR